MTKYQFEKELAAKLEAAPETERQKVLDYYRELFEEKAEKGLSERDIIASFGDPAAIAADVLGESVFNKNVKRVKTQARSFFTNKNFLIAYFAGFMITFPLTIVVLSVFLSIGIIAFAAVLSVAICGVAFVIAGPVGMGYGIYMMFDNVGAGLAQAGAGLALLAAGIMLLMLLKVFDFLRIMLFVKKANWKESFAGATRHKKTYAVLCIVCIGLLALAGGLFAGGMGKANWSFTKLDIAEHTPVVKELDGPVNRIEINMTSRNISIMAADDNWRVETYNYKNKKTTNTVAITFDDGVLTITESGSYSAHEVFNVFTGINGKKRDVYVYVPVNIAEFNVKATSGNIKAGGLSADTMNIKTTSGNLDIRNCASDVMKLTVTSGDITVTQCTARDLEAKTTSGDVTVRLVGESAEYSIHVSTTSGNKNISNQTVAGDKRVHLQARSGNVKLYFV